LQRHCATGQHHLDAAALHIGGTPGGHEEVGCIVGAAERVNDFETVAFGL